MAEILSDFLEFLQNSPTSWHAAAEISNRLIQHDYTQIDEDQRWNLSAGGKYFVQRGGALIAFSLPEKTPKRAVIAASHTDSPSLKIKPHAEFRSHNMNLFRVDAYGGPLLSTWFDRDLAIAGQIYVDDGKQLSRHLIYADDHQVTIPSLAIHLAEKKEGVPKQYLDKQEHLCPLVGISEKEKNSLEKILKSHVKYQELLASDLYLVPTQPPAFLGAEEDLIAAYRLDNLSSAHASLTGLLHASDPKNQTIQVAIFWNHEEIGSDTREGACSPFLDETLKRISLSFSLDEEDFIRLKTSSICLSIDVSHCYHPSYPKRYDTQDHPLFGHGMILKHSSNLRYATTAHSAAAVAYLCKKHKIAYQDSAGHSEIRGGTTVGPITASTMGITTVDLGVPLLAMHSTRELVASKDHLGLCQFIKIAFEELTL